MANWEYFHTKLKTIEIELVNLQCFRLFKATNWMFSVPNECIMNATQTGSRQVSFYKHI